MSSLMHIECVMPDVLQPDGCCHLQAASATRNVLACATLLLCIGSASDALAGWYFLLIILSCANVLPSAAAWYPGWSVRLMTDVPSADMQ